MEFLELKITRNEKSSNDPNCKLNTTEEKMEEFEDRYLTIHRDFCFYFIQIFILYDGICLPL